MTTDRARSLRLNQTGPERAMWRILWLFREQGWHFRREQPIGPYYADFACMHARLIVEVDGDTHVDPARDDVRDTYMRERGLHVLRFHNDDVLHNEDGVYRVIADVLGVVTAVANTPHPVPPPQGGRRPSQSAITAEPTEQAEPSIGSSPPLAGEDRGGGIFHAPASPDDEGK